MSEGTDVGRAQVFSCTAGGAIAAGRRRLTSLLLGPAVLMLALAAAMFVSDRIFPGLLCLLVAGVLVVAWRMNSDQEPLHLEVADGRLVVRLRWNRFELPLTELAARRLSEDERSHLERLASAGGVVTSSGGFDSHLLGEFDLYASDLRHAVLVESEDSRFIVTPDDPHRFAEAVGTIRIS